jgi:ribosome-associated protein
MNHRKAVKYLKDFNNKINPEHDLSIFWVNSVPEGDMEALTQVQLKPPYFSTMQEPFELRGTHIELNKLLKAVGWAETGGHAKQRIQEGEILRNNAIETRVRAKLVHGDVIECDGLSVRIQAAEER